MLADRHGPRFFMGVGPLVTAAGLALFMRLDENVDYLTDLLPALLVFSLGLSMTVAPLTATVLADADEHNAGVASGVNNAIARVAGLVAIASVGAVVAASYGSSLEEKLGALADRPELVRARWPTPSASRWRPFPPASCRSAFAPGSSRPPIDASVEVLPARRGHRRGARGPRRHRRADRDPEPAPAGGGGRLSRRPARRGAGGGCPRLALRLGPRGSRESPAPA